MPVLRAAAAEVARVKKMQDDAMEKLKKEVEDMKIADAKRIEDAKKAQDEIDRKKQAKERERKRADEKAAKKKLPRKSTQEIKNY